MHRCFKNIPVKFQSRPTFLAGFFSKKVTDDDDRRKTFFLASCSEYSSLIYRVVTMEYRTSDRGNAYISSEYVQLGTVKLSRWHHWLNFIKTNGAAPRAAKSAQ